MHIWIYTFVCVYVCFCVCMYVYVHIHIYIYIYILPSTPTPPARPLRPSPLSFVPLLPPVQHAHTRVNEHTYTQKGHA